MGKCKHNPGARTKSSANYKSSGRRSENKLKKQKMIESGKIPKNPYRVAHKTEDMKFDTAYRNMMYAYNPDEEKKAIKENRVYLKPKSLNKTCVR